MVMSNSANLFLWQEKALCAGEDTQIFFDTNARKAKSICKYCPVKDECYEFAMVYNLSGVWGGTTDKERGRKTLLKELIRDDYIESDRYNAALKV